MLLLANQVPDNAVDLEHCVFEAVAEHAQTTKKSLWKRPRFQHLIQKRQGMKCRFVRTNLVKQIRTYINKYMRAKKNKRPTAILDEFVDLNRFDTIMQEPIIREK